MPLWHCLPLVATALFLHPVRRTPVPAVPSYPIFLFQYQFESVPLCPYVNTSVWLYVHVCTTHVHVLHTLFKRQTDLTFQNECPTVFVKVKPPAPSPGRNVAPFGTTDTHHPSRPSNQTNCVRPPIYRTHVATHMPQSRKTSPHHHPPRLTMYCTTTQPFLSTWGLATCHT